MTFWGWISQASLALFGAMHIGWGGFDDLRLAVAIAAILLVLLMNLWIGTTRSWLAMAAFLPLAVYSGAALSFLPLALYAALYSASPLALASGASLLLLYHAHAADLLLVLMHGLAGMLYWKDTAYQGLIARHFQQADASRALETSQRKENLALQLSQENAVRLGIAQERNRIARDIHDSVGHLLSRSILQVAALSITVRDPGQQAQLRDLKETLDTAMTATRASVHNTRQDALHLDREIRALVDAFTFCEVRYTNQSATELSLNQKYVLMAIIQEALNNVMKHSNATLVTITLSHVRNGHALLIADNGTQARKGAGAGLGLAAMEERVRGLGGSMHIARERGFRLLITLPTEERHGSDHRG